MQSKDQDYVFETLRGDKEAYGKLVDSYQGMVFAIAMSITGNYSDSQDIAQEAFLHAYRKLRTLSNPSKYGKWLYTIAKRIAWHFLKEKHRISHYSAEDADIEQIKSTTESPSDASSRKEFSALIWKKVNDIPKKQREAILLYYMEGCSVKTAAAFLDISEATMKKRLQFGRERLHLKLAKETEIELSRYRSSKNTRSAVLAALPAGGVPKIGLLGSLATKGGLTMAAISAKKVAIIAAVVIIGVITTVTIHKNLPKAPSPTPPIISEKKKDDNDRAVKKKTVTKSPRLRYQTPSESKTTWKISGKVQDDQDNLVSKAEIKVYDSSKPDTAVFRDISDEKGAFEIKDLKANHQYNLIAEHEDYFPEKVENIDTGLSNLVITFRTGATIPGIAVDFYDNPIKNATISFEPYDYDENKRGYYGEKTKITFTGNLIR